MVMRRALPLLLAATIASAEPPATSAPASASIPASASGAASLPADAPQQPHTLLFPDGGRCENAAAAKAEDKLLADARAEQVKPVLAAAGVGLVVGLVLGVVVGVLAQPLTKPKP